jgi:hypothetical protein
MWDVTQKITLAHEEPEGKSALGGGRREATPLLVKTKLIGGLSIKKRDS